MATPSSSSTASKHTEAISTLHQGSGTWSDGTTGSDDSSIVITRHKLNGNKYLSWSGEVEMFVTCKGKEEYLYRTMIVPNEVDSKFRVWKYENSIMIMSWLIRSMISEISDVFMMYEIAHEICIVVKEMYSKPDNTSVLYEIEAQFHENK